jgi:hypothetical protein
MKASEVLIKARTVIEEKGWTQDVLARDEYNRAVDVKSAPACKFCALGALRSVWNPCNKKDPEIYLRDAMNGYISYCNDNSRTRKEHVLMAYDFAILMAQGEGD